MSTVSESVPVEVQSLVDQKKFDAVGDLWKRKMEEDAEDLPFFFGVAAAAKKKGAGAQAVGWLRSLAEFHDVGEGGARTKVLLEIARMSPSDAEVRKELTATLKKRFAGWRCYIFTADLRLPKLIRLQPSRRTPLWNGSLECRLYEFRIVSGSNRA